jgi:hypothetical protein
MDAALRNIQSRMLDTLRDLMDARKRLGAVEWQRQFERAIIEFHAAAYFAGQGSNDLSGRGDARLGVLMQQQLDFFAGFAQDVGRLSPAQAQARAALYAGPLGATYSSGKFALWDLPFQPGQGTPCRGNCRCEWRLEVNDLEELNARAYWQLGQAEHCEGCKARAARNPYVFIEGVLR